MRFVSEFGKGTRDLLPKTPSDLFSGLVKERPSDLMTRGAIDVSTFIFQRQGRREVGTPIHPLVFGRSPVNQLEKKPEQYFHDAAGDLTRSEGRVIDWSLVSPREAKGLVRGYQPSGLNRFSLGGADKPFLRSPIGVGHAEPTALRRSRAKAPLSRATAHIAADRVTKTYRPFSIIKEGQDRRFHFVLPDLNKDNFAKRHERFFGDIFEGVQFVDTLVSGVDPISLAIEGVITVSVERFAFVHGNGPTQFAELTKQRKQGSCANTYALATAYQLDKLLCSMDATPHPALLIVRGKLAQQIIGESAVEMALDYTLQDRHTAFCEQLREQHRLIMLSQVELLGRIERLESESVAVHHGFGQGRYLLRTAER
jgi:hypothetical protein